jgi:hypothetical protein
MNNPNVTLNLDEILDVALRSVRRTYAFLALGVRASALPDVGNLDLTHLTNIRLLPDLSEAHIQEIKQEFNTWVVACGFRELNETFSVFLDHVYAACRLIAASENGKIRSDAIVGVPKNYSHGGLRDKIASLRKQFGLEVPHGDQLDSLSLARRCFAHRRGVVGQEDASETGELAVRWIATDSVIQLNDGREILLPPVMRDPIETSTGGALVLKVVERRTTFAVGRTISFSEHELAEICWFHLRTAIAVRDALMDFVQKNNVPVSAIAVPAESTQQSAN